MIKQNIKRILSGIPNGMNLSAATKTRAVQEIKEAIDSGIKIIAENRVQEAERKFNDLKTYLKKNSVGFHFIGHLQTNKVKKAVEMFDVIESLDSLNLAKEIDKRAA